MQKTAIEWTDYTSNPVKGYCPMACSYCYALKIYDRFGWDKTIRFIPEEIEEWNKAKPGAKIFVGSTIEMFGDWVKNSWLEEIFKHTKLYPDLTFQFLTKQPQSLRKWSPFPDNCWVGVTATNQDMFERGIYHLRHIKARIIYMSLEPLLERIKSIHIGIHELNQIIIGAQTKPYKPPKLSWVQEIIEAADSAGVKVFLKDNLKPLLVQNRDDQEYAPRWANGGYGTLRQEMPKC